MGFWSWLLGSNKSEVLSSKYDRPAAGQTPMDQGDYHSGPAGYSPNTPYPETQYGSGFDEDAAWHEGEN
jgi:hypothetical protein